MKTTHRTKNSGSKKSLFVLGSLAALSVLAASRLAAGHPDILRAPPFRQWISAASDLISGAPGNVGIGTSSPAQKLDVSGNIGTSGSIVFADSSSLSSAATGGDLSGTLDAPHVVALHGNGVSSASPQDGDLLSWNASAGLWVPVAPDVETREGTCLSGSLVAQEHFNGTVSGWSSNSTSSCSTYGPILGPLGPSQPQVSKTYTGLANHTRVKITADYYLIGTWDDETAYLEIDGSRVWEVTFDWQNPDVSSFFCPESGLSYRILPINVTVPHTGPSLTVTVGSTVDTNLPDEAGGLDDLRVTTCMN